MYTTTLIFLTLSNSITLRREKSILYIRATLIILVTALIIYFTPTIFNWNTVYFYFLIILTLAAANFLLLLYNNPGKLDLYMGEYVGVFLANFEYTLESTISFSSFNNTFILLNIVLMITMTINGITFSNIEAGNRSSFFDIWNNKGHYLFYIWENKGYLFIHLLLIWSVIFIINSMLFMVGLGIVVDTTTTKMFLYTFLAKITSIRIVLIIITSSISKELRRRDLSLSISTLLVMITLGWFNYLYIIPYIQMLAFPVLADLSVRYTNICLYVNNIKVSSFQLLMEYLNNIYNGFTSRLDGCKYYYSLIYQKTCINRASFIEINHNKPLVTKKPIPQFTPKIYNNNPITFIGKEREVTYHYNGTVNNLTFLINDYIHLFAANISNHILNSSRLGCKINLTLPQEKIRIEMVIKNGCLKWFDLDRTQVNLKNSYSYKDSSFNCEPKDNNRQKIIDATAPTIRVSDLKVYMQSNTSYDNPSYNGESSREPLLQNTATNRVRSVNPIGAQGIEVKVIDVNNRTLSLKFDLNKLSGYSQDYSIEWKIYLLYILNELRVVFFERWGVVPESATIDNILLDYDIETDQEVHLETLCGAIKKAGGLDIYLVDFCLLSDNFMQYLYKSTKDSVYIQSDYIQDSELELDHTTDTTDHSNYNNYMEPLSNEEMLSLRDDLICRQDNAPSSAKSTLTHLGIHKSRTNSNILLDTEDKVYLLLTRLYNTKTEWFRWSVNKYGGYYNISNTIVADLTTNLEESIGYGGLWIPLTPNEIESLICELRARQYIIPSCPKSYLSHLNISLNRSRKRVMIDKEVHSLLTKLYNTKPHCFLTNGKVHIPGARINRLVENLNNLKSGN